MRIEAIFLARLSEKSKCNAREVLIFVIHIQFTTFDL